ncbi:MAG: alkaline phosphatase family protein, partial [Nanoarchaeota archaeon]|nr:alkaline phosphatase family protein [Nanoarchaeota archaeon]
PFWRITSKAGIPTTIIRWPVTFPPERIKGNMFSGLGVPDIKGFLSGYTYYTSKTTNGLNKASKKIIPVTVKDKLIETEIFGPKIKKSNNIIDIKVSMQIQISKDSTDIILDNNKYSLKPNEWSDWIRAKFNIGMFKSVYGIFKAYLISTDPFEMYITTIQIDPENPVVKISYPNKYSTELAKDIGLYYTLGMPEETDGYVDDKLSEEAFLDQTNDIEEQRNKMFWKEFNEFKGRKTGVFAFVYDTSDRLQHVFWDEKVLEKDDNKLKVNKVIVDNYVRKDEFIETLMKQIDDNTLLIIISDHGFTSFERAVSINTWLVENSFMTLTKYIGDDKAPLFQYVDWDNTKAYSLGFNSIYINLKGREEKGIIEDRNTIVKEIIKKLENLTDKKTGKKVINKAYKSEDIYQGNHVKDAPDIIIGFNPGYRMSWQNAIGGFTKETINNNTKKWNGDHLIDPCLVPGVLFSNVKFNKTSANQPDIIPTIFDALNIHKPDYLDGKSLFE